MLRDHAARVLAERGCPLLWHPDANLPGGIVSFQAPDEKTAALFKKLDQQFALSLRQDKAGAEWIRVSAHWMNIESDIDALAAQIKE
jgi:selenocysteine lyase/cysteine desulfurase